MNENEEMLRLACLAYKDEMTGLNNKNFYFCMRKKIAFQMIKDLLNSNSRGGQGIWSILFCDVNNLKYINDTLGHHIGDEGLIELTNIINSSIRKNREINDDVLTSNFEEGFNIRFGGDEFLILLPNCKMKDALLVKERLKSNINKNLVKTRGLSLAIGITDTTALSINEVTTDEEVIGFLEKLIKLAEEDMYEDKFKDIKAMPREKQYELIHKSLVRLKSIGINIEKLEDLDFLIDHLVEKRKELDFSKVKKQ